jgi:hypothetical protein
VKIYRNRSVSSADKIHRIRCSVCDTLNDPRKRPSGGRFYGLNETTTINGKTVYRVKEASNGCIFCQSTAWRTGGKAGDLKPPW